MQSTWTLRNEGLAGNLVIFVSNEAQQLLLLATEGKMGFGLGVGYNSSVQQQLCATLAGHRESLRILPEHKGIWFGCSFVTQVSGNCWDSHLEGTEHLQSFHPHGISDIPLDQVHEISEHTAVTESQNCLGWESPQRSPKSLHSPALPRPPLPHVPKCRIHTTVKPLQGWKLQHCLGQLCLGWTIL